MALGPKGGGEELKYGIFNGDNQNACNYYCEQVTCGLVQIQIFQNNTTTVYSQVTQAVYRHRAKGF